MRDVGMGRLSAQDAVAARGELARELLRSESEASRSEVGSLNPFVVPTVIALVLAVGVVTYSAGGQPQLPAAPLSERAEFGDAVAQIEQHLAQNPDDLRGWELLGPVYMQAARYEDAVRAFRRVLDLAGATADRETDLAEALLMAGHASDTPEAVTLLNRAASRDPAHLRSRFYLADHAMRAGQFPAAAAWWRQVLDLATGSEPWIDAARQGLRTAEAGGESTTGMPALSPDADSEQANMIRGMVDGLEQRLLANGGSAEEWTQLVRSLLVLGATERAQIAYGRARLAFPGAADRAALDALAREGGLQAGEEGR